MVSPVDMQWLEEPELERTRRYQRTMLLSIVAHLFFFSLFYSAGFSPPASSSTNPWIPPSAPTRTSRTGPRVFATTHRHPVGGGAISIPSFYTA